MGVNFHRTVKLKSAIELDFSSKEDDSKFDIYDKLILLRSGDLETHFAAGLSLNGDVGELEFFNGIVNKFKHEIKGLSSLDPGVNIVMDHNCQLRIQDYQGQVVQPEKEEWIRQNYFRELLHLLNLVCQHCNHLLLRMLTIYRGTPLPDTPLDWKKYYEPLQLSEPEEPLYQPVGWIDRLFPWKARAIEAENNKLRNSYRCQQIAWQRQVDHHEYQQRQLWDNRLANTANVLEFLQHTLDQLDWPLPLAVQVTVDDDLDTICLDTWLSEPDELPAMECEVSAKDFSLTSKYLSISERKENYRHYIYGIGLRLVGEVFRALPVKTIIFSSYKKSGQAIRHSEDESLYSVKVSRQEWQSQDFTRFETLSPAELMASFEFQCHTSQTGNI